MTEPHPWEVAAEGAAESLDGLHAVLVVGRDPDATAHAALGIATAQAARRRVAVADLLGEHPAFESRIAGPVEHGLVDSFAYGVSLNQIAQPVTTPGAKNLFILPSGAGPIDYEFIVGSDRWKRLASGFREVGALLIAVVPDGAPAIEGMLANFDGFIGVGDTSLPEQALIRRLDPTVAVAATVTRDTAPAAEEAYTDPRELIASRTAAANTSREPADRRRMAPLIGTIAALLVLAAIGALLLNPMRSGEPPAVADVVGAPEAAAAVEDAGTAVPIDTLPAVTIANPADSAAAAAFSVQLASHTGQTSALGHVETAAGRAVPAITFSPVITGPANARWYRVLAGAFVDRSAADSLLAQLRRRGSLQAEQGEVRYAPFSILLERGLRREQTAASIREYRTRGIPAYALLQNDGSVNLYAGAFETAEQASLLLDTLRQRGEEPQVVYRLGRVF